jgi:hypothetical protein
MTGTLAGAPPPLGRKQKWRRFSIHPNCKPICHTFHLDEELPRCCRQRNPVLALLLGMA